MEFAFDDGSSNSDVGLRQILKLYPLSMRDSCFECKFASNTRFGDFTIGDLWEAPKTVHIYDHKGVSVLAVNSEKGKLLLDDLKESCKLIPILKSQLTQNAIRKPMERPVLTDDFWKDYLSRGYAIPVIFIIGWRGEPGIHDEPQHIYQGEVTVKLLDNMGIDSYIIGTETTEEELQSKMEEFKASLAAGKDVAFVIRKGALTDAPKIEYKNDNKMVREEIIRHIVNVSGEDPIVSTTGKASRELFETREANGQSHKYDFLTVGSMGHSSSIALGVAINKPDTRVWCVDGDGAVLMHMGAMAVLGANQPKNLIHVVINNGAHETVGGMPTVASNIDLVSIAKACGYPNSVCVDNFESLDKELDAAKERNELSFIEVKCSIGARDNLGRPTTTALENKQNFIEYLETL